MKIQKPTVGRIVEVAVMDKERGHVAHRPGIVVNTSMGGDLGVNVRVWLDGSNDRGILAGRVGSSLVEVGNHWHALWLTSVHYQGDGTLPEGHLATWRYPPRSDVEIEVAE